MISKDLLNKNRILTMSTNRKCNYLIVNVGQTDTYMMGVNTQGNTKDILVLKSFTNMKYEELVNEAYWICKEYDIQIILADNRGCGLGFIDTFNDMISTHYVQVRTVDGMRVFNMMDSTAGIINDLNNGILRFLQSPELAENTYLKSFLGLSTIMNFHKETNKLIDEISNLEIKLKPNGTIYYNSINSNIGKQRFSCLLTLYSYPECLVDFNKVQQNNIDKYNISKRMANYEVLHGTFYKYLFKCSEVENINVIFYCSEKNKFKQFANMANEKDFDVLFKDKIRRLLISKDDLRIELNNGSNIKFVIANDGVRGHRFHYAVVDKSIDMEMCQNVVYPKGILFDIAKRNGKLSDNYNIEFIDM